MSRTSKKVVQRALLSPVVVVAAGFWLLVVHIFGGDTLRYESLKLYTSDLYSLPVPATFIGGSRVSFSTFSPDQGDEPAVSIERDYALQRPVSWEAVSAFYNSKLESHGWSHGPHTESDASDSQYGDFFQWSRPGIDDDTLILTVGCDYGTTNAAETDYPYADYLSLELESDPNSSFGK